MTSEVGVRSQALTEACDRCAITSSNGAIGIRQWKPGPSPRQGCRPGTGRGLLMQSRRAVRRSGVQEKNARERLPDTGLPSIPRRRWRRQGCCGRHREAMVRNGAESTVDWARVQSHDAGGHVRILAMLRSKVASVKHCVAWRVPAVRRGRRRNMLCMPSIGT
jgi:hypothetical protein